MNEFTEEEAELWEEMLKHVDRILKISSEDEILKRKIAEFDENDMKWPQLPMIN